MENINQKHGLDIGDLAKYMSRTVLVTDIDEEWVYGIELADDRAEVGKYKRHVLKAII
jgi:hypothetical protein